MKSVALICSCMGHMWATKEATDATNEVRVFLGQWMQLRACCQTKAVEAKERKARAFSKEVKSKSDKPDPL